MIKLTIAGARGRMGQAIDSLAQHDPNKFNVVCKLEAKLVDTFSAVGGPKDDPILTADSNKIVNSDVIIDFSTVSATLEHIESAIKYKKPVVIGTTGFSAEQQQKIVQASKIIPIVQSPNMSLGMNVMFLAAQLIARGLQARDILISEVHHTRKKDAPSGSALKLFESVKSVISDRPGTSLPLPLSERGGDEVGEHVLKFYGWEERIVLTHDAESRGPFAAGALHAANWISKQKSGLYSMFDVLELNHVLDYIQKLHSVGS